MAPINQLRVRLPELKLPQFGGCTKDWPTFRDSFKSLIDSAPQLSNVDKFSYLNSSLTSEAKRVIEVIDVTSENYLVAWELLEKRYENKYLIVKSYVESLFSVEPMKKECHDSLNRLIDEYERNLLMLEKMGERTDNWSTLLVFMLSSRLDPSTMRQWETHRKSSNVPSYEELIDFLRSHSLILQSVVASKNRSSEPTRFTPSLQHSINKMKTAHPAISPPQNSCPFCKQIAHSPYHCEKFRSMTVAQRFEAAKKNMLCINCLSRSHLVKNCSSGACRVCNKRHHTMLHQRTNSNPPNQPQNANLALPEVQPPLSSSVASKLLQPSRSSSHSQSLENPTPTVSAFSTSHNSMPSTSHRCTVPTTVLLSTALVKVFDSSGSFLWARALLDSGSQLNFASEQLVQKLNSKRKKDFIPISGVGLSSTISKYSTIIKLQSHGTSFSASWNFHILPKITMELPTQTVDVSDFDWPSDITLADPSFFKPGSIDLIFGVESFYDLLREGQFKGSTDKPCLQNTALGWVISGRMKCNSRPATSVAHFCAAPSIEEQLSRFWELESCRMESTLSEEESACESHFAKHTTRNSTGRFVVALPRRDSVIAKLGNSREIATRRFLSLERRLSANPALKDAYSDFIHEYIRLGHMREIENSANDWPSYYLPHHCVVRPESVTTKLRVVFDASCSTDSGVSLNDALMVGPLVQDDLLTMILRFRVPQFAIVSDIEKMYRQILVCESDQPLQRILWRDSPSQTIREYQLLTVTYGTSSAPYLATKCLQRLSRDSLEVSPLAAETIGKNFYMDDLLTGTDSIEEGQKLCQQLMSITRSAGFELRKWASNNSAVLEPIPVSFRDQRTVLELDSSHSPIKTLGLQWDTAADMFLFEPPKQNQQFPITKRVVLSNIARLFDPLGLVGPVTVLAKQFMQDLWRDGKDWDDQLNESQNQQWNEFSEGLRDLSLIKIPRWVVSTSAVIGLELHGFCDASEKAYGACIYIRAVSSTGSVHPEEYGLMYQVPKIRQTSYQEECMLLNSLT
ncbi:uncharacterized protein LOC128735701 [Sabethes cyaneus]|uniref:uncharacterized protein LOC128735701 n=1 Tax=Sabethes cyaneus TaxID=53552 RepID=UPI00237DC1C1|nr:uncharacterized protein LOC128735701 [Sabethes cyaneus]